VNLRDRAAEDAKNILNDLGGAGTEFIFSNGNADYKISGVYGDIGYLLDMSTGTAVEGRTIEAVYSLATLAALTNEEPQKGWGFRCNDLSGRELKLFVVKYEPDRTIGVGRIKLAVKLQ